MLVIMSPKIKFIAGIFLAAAGVYLLIPRSWLIDYGLPAFGYGRFLVPILQGAIPVLMVAFGVILAWVMWENMQEEKSRKENK